jgi:thioredoxin reductase (NADPH)
MYQSQVRRHIFFFTAMLHCFFLAGIDIHTKVAIMGTGPAGLTAAIYTARAGLSSIVLEGDEPGGQIALSYEVENFPGFPEGVSGFELGQKMREQAARFGASYVSGKVTSVDLSKRPFCLQTGETRIMADVLIIAAGASAKWLGLESEKTFIGKGVSSCAVCDGFFFHDQEVVVVGGGDTAMEDALFLSHYASKVTVVHRGSTLRASSYLQQKAFSNEKIHFIWDSVVEEIGDVEAEEVKYVFIRNVKNQEYRKIDCGGVFIAIGHQPNSSVFEGQLELNEAGYILTKPFSTATNIPGVFAAGDIVDFRYRQAITAAGTGCMAGIDAYQYIQEHEE